MQALPTSPSRRPISTYGPTRRRRPVMRNSDKEPGLSIPERRNILPAPVPSLSGRARFWFFKIWSFVLFEIILLHRTCRWADNFEHIMDALRLLRAMQEIARVCAQGDAEVAKSSCLHQIETKWRRFLKSRIRWWKGLAGLQIVLFSGFVMSIIQTARNDDPATRALSLISGVQLFVAIGLIIMVPAQFDKDTRKLPFAAHFQELHDRKRSFYAPTAPVLLVPMAAFVWSLVPALATVCSAYYKTVVPSATPSDTDVYLPRGWWIVALITLGLLILVDVLIATWVFVQLQQYSAAESHGRPSERAVVVEHHVPLDAR
uniref:Uncharacterized protein n=1 Tax=Mycena chlorophos TaxID=658473 RepID=A0ABQ0LFQ1_MYCCL|nr:predicted protein [Mycena chlorophos]